MPIVRVIRVGWFAFEGFGRPVEGWRQHSDGHWQCAGRAFTHPGAARKARKLADLKRKADFTTTTGAGPAR